MSPQKVGAEFSANLSTPPSAREIRGPAPVVPLSAEPAPQFIVDDHCRIN